MSDVMGTESKWTRKGTSYPQWFIDRLVNEEDKELARTNRLSSKHDVMIRCAHCDNVLARKVYNVVSKKTGEPTRPCLCKECYNKWETDHLDTMHENVQNTYRERRTTNIPQEVLDSLSEKSREELLSGTLMRHHNAEFVCSKCQKKYTVVFRNRWDADFKPVFPNHCEECAKESGAERAKAVYVKRRNEYAQEFIDALYYDKDKERAKDRTLSTKEVLTFHCSVCGKPVEKHAHLMYDTENKRMRQMIYCIDCSPRNKSQLEDEIYEEVKSIYNGTIKRCVRDVLPRISHIPYELDIYIPEKKIAIEVNGSYWHASSPNVKAPVSPEHHFKKFALCRDNGIRLITIFDVDWWNQKRQIMHLLKSLLGTVDEAHIVNAYSLNSVELTIEEGRAFFALHGNPRHDDDLNERETGYVGLEASDRTLLSVMSYGKPSDEDVKKRKENAVELIRFSTIASWRVIDGFKKLMNKVCTITKPDVIYTKTNNDISNGKPLEKLGFSLDACEGYVPPHYWFKVTTRDYVYGHALKERSLRKKYADLSARLADVHDRDFEEALMLKREYVKCFRCGDERWRKINDRKKTVNKA